MTTVTQIQDTPVHALTRETLDRIVKDLISILGEQNVEQLTYHALNQSMGGFCKIAQVYLPGWSMIQTRHTQLVLLRWIQNT